MSEKDVKADFIVCEGLIDYVDRCVNYNSIGELLPILRSSDASQPLDTERWCERILDAPVGSLKSRGRHGGTAVIATRGATAVCAAFFAATTGRDFRLLAKLDEFSGVSADLSGGIIVLAQEEANDGLIFGILDQFATGLDSTVPWSKLPRFTLLTGRDLAALSWMVAKLILAARQPPRNLIRLRHYAPEHDRSNVSEVHVGEIHEVVHRHPLSGLALFDSYRKKAEVIAFRTHGSEACANGGDGTVLCGLALNGVDFPPLAEGVLACGRGLRCPRGPNPIPLNQMAADVLMLGTCNGLRLANSRTLPEFNFALSFVDGAGVAFVSSVFSSIGGDVASIAFLAAMAMGQSLGEATALINALIHHTRLERTSYMALGDSEYSVRPRNAIDPPSEIKKLPYSIDLGKTHFTTLKITDASIVERARRERLTLSFGLRENDAHVFGFHRVEQHCSEDFVLVAYLFSFPHTLGKVDIDWADPISVRERARASLAYLDTWINLWRVVGLSIADSEAYVDLRDGCEDLREKLAESLALLSVDGGVVSRIEREVATVERFISAASIGVMDHITPQLVGSFWLPNLHTSQYRFQSGEPTSCPHCNLRALRRTMRHGLTDLTRIMVVCPRCGICSDTAGDSPLEALSIEAPHLAAAGDSFHVTIVVRIARSTPLDVRPRLSTHGEQTQTPEPEAVSSPVMAAGTFRLPFIFQLPLTLSPHRHYIKLLVATTADLAFASRPFFVRPHHS